MIDKYQMDHTYITLGHDSIYFRYKSPENYYHFLIYMVSNLRHINYNGIKRVYIQLAAPQLFKKDGYIMEVLRCILPNMYSITSVAKNPENVPVLEYNPNPDNLGRGESYAKGAYMFIRNVLMPYIIRKDVGNYKRIYVSREKASKRKINNEAELVKHLEKYEFHVIYLEHHDSMNQMAYFHNAEIIISPHGAGLTNILFCKENTRVIEIASAQMTSLQHFEHIAESINLNYSKYQDVVPDSESADSNMTINTTNLTF